MLLQVQLPPVEGAGAGARFNRETLRRLGLRSARAYRLYLGLVAEWDRLGRRGVPPTWPGFGKAGAAAAGSVNSTLTGPSKPWRSSVRSPWSGTRTIRGSIGRGGSIWTEQGPAHRLYPWGATQHAGILFGHSETPEDQNPRSAKEPHGVSRAAGIRIRKGDSERGCARA